MSLDRAVRQLAEQPRIPVLIDARDLEIALERCDDMSVALRDCITPDLVLAHLDELIELVILIDGWDRIADDEALWSALHAELNAQPKLRVIITSRELSLRTETCEI